MSVPLSTFANARNLDAAVLKGVSRAELVDALRTWFDLWEGRPHLLDFEVIGDAGSLIGDAGYDNIDDDAWNWGGMAPSLIRNEITSDFLAGYWRTAPVVNAEVVTNAIRSLDRLPSESSAYGSALLALYKLAGASDPRVSSELRGEVRAHLLGRLSQLEATGLHKGIAGTLVHLRGAEGTRSQQHTADE